MPILKYENLTHVELAGLSRDKTVVFIPVGPLEQHGPHLPLGTDAMSAEFFSRKLSERLDASRSSWNFLILPSLYAGSDTLTFTGSVEVRPTVLRAMLLSCCKQLAKDGFRQIVLLGTHGGPRHMVVLEEVANKLRWRYKVRAISASAKALYAILHGDFADRIVARAEKDGVAVSIEEKTALKTDYHGGMLETSLMMVARPDLVKPEYKTLKPALVENYWKLRRSSVKKVGEGLGYLGSPALARPEVGQAAIDVFLDETIPLLERFLDGEDVAKQFRSKFYFIPFFRTDFPALMILLVYPILVFIAWSIMNKLAWEIMGVTK